MIAVTVSALITYLMFGFEYAMFFGIMLIFQIITPTQERTEMTTEKCNVCSRDPNRMNSEIAECSHPDCPHRRKAWSERPTPSQLFKGPWKKNSSEDPRPLDKAPEMGNKQ